MQDELIAPVQTKVHLYFICIIVSLEAWSTVLGIYMLKMTLAFTLTVTFPCLALYTPGFSLHCGHFPAWACNSCWEKTMWKYVFIFILLIWGAQLCNFQVSFPLKSDISDLDFRTELLTPGFIPTSAHPILCESNSVNRVYTKLDAKQT